MSKKIVKKTKIKFVNLLLGLLFLFGLFFVVYFICQIPIQNIIVENTTYLNDDYILELADVIDYPKFIFLSSSKMKKDLEKSNYIESVKIKKKFGFVLKIYVDEALPLFYDFNSNKYVLENDKRCDRDEISQKFRVPRLLNYVPDDKYKKFINGMSSVKSDILSKVSEIEYRPNDYDKDRFLLYMDDGNMVYLTLTKFKMINHYNEVLTQLEGHKGILYLDSGNHFQIME